ncbi:Transcriptional regulator [Pseudomonas syringae pv. apii]|uniref:Transcriptional regulator n=1 Tax=Pseudomonas syringae pv. apii TaxID=81036 RepID=A0A3M3S220_9PSED|nr:Transcriptional regulator [Pseudomonas syringae pv. apii]
MGGALTVDKSGNLDRQDLEIIKRLAQDSRITMQELGNLVGLSSTPCWNRMKALESSGIIKKFGVTVDNAKLGYHQQIMVQIKLADHSDATVDGFQKGLHSIPEVTEAYLVSGSCDYLLKVVAKSTEDFEQLLRQKLAKLPGVQQTQCSIVFKTLKNCALPF